MAQNPAPEVDAAEGHRLVTAGALLLDVREDDEWAAGHVPDAVHIALGQLGTDYESLPKDARIVAICRSGGRSARAAAALNEAGYDVINLAGGMRAWAEAGFSIMSADGTAGRVI